MNISKCVNVEKCLFRKIAIPNNASLRGWHMTSSDQRQSRRYFSEHVTRPLRKNNWESVVGLEVHAQIHSKSKLFSGSGVSFSAPVNSQVSIFDAALPGTLPVLNRYCVEAAVLTSLALQCHVNTVSEFDRKHYFYADLPTGYQITQQRRPIAQNGRLSFPVLNVPKPYLHEAKVIQLQLEQDSGKSLHDEIGNVSLIDLNRAGVPLMEIVFDANLSTGEEAAALIEELRFLLQQIKTCDGKMDEGSMRVDANVSVNQRGHPWGVRTEVKNINSMRAVAKAVEYEINRQIADLEAGKEVENETRMYDSKLKATVPMRDKETKQEYRFMPEPNLPPLHLKENGKSSSTRISIFEVAKRLPPHLPCSQRTELLEKYDFPLQVVDRIIKQEGLLAYFLEMVNLGKHQPKTIIYFLLNDVNRLLNKFEITLNECPVSTTVLSEVLDLHISRRITGPNKLEMLEELFTDNTRTPSEILALKNWIIISDDVEIERICKEVIAENSNPIKKKKRSEEDKLKILKANVWKKTNGQIDMRIVETTMKRLLTE